jgi:hypothetical protein
VHIESLAQGFFDAVRYENADLASCDTLVKQVTKRHKPNISKLHCECLQNNVRIGMRDRIHSIYSD